MRPERQALADWLNRQHFTDFFTVTFRTEHRDSINTLHRVAEYLPQAVAVKKAFLATERFHLGIGLHVHGLLERAWYDSDNPAYDYEAWSGCFKRFGRSRFEPVRGGEDVSLYCSKYILKSNDDSLNWTVTGLATDWVK